MREHELKTWPEYFKYVQSGAKPFEVRKNDRDFKVGDWLILQEYDPGTEEYTGNYVYVLVTYILHGGNFGIEDGYCVLGFN